MHHTITHHYPKISKLPACSGIALEIIHYSQDGEIDKSSFLKLVSSDPILTLQILKAANATVFNYPRKISSLEKAMVILGFEMVRDIALSLSVMSLLKGQIHQKYVHQICHHSLITAFSLKMLAQNYDSDHKELLYLGGLLHDIGKILLLNRLGDEYYYLLEKYKQENKSLMELEIKFLGYDHAEVGADLAEQWNLPTSVVSMIRFHHSPEKETSGYKQEFRNQLVYLGNLIARSLKENFEDPIHIEELEPDLQKNLAISARDYTHIIDETRKEIKSQIINFKSLSDRDVMKKTENITANLDSIISSLKKIEDNATIFAELGKISGELSSLNKYIHDGLQKIDFQYDSFSDSVNLLSDLIDFQKKVIHNKSSEKTIEAIFNFLNKNIPYQQGFVLYKLKEDDPHYDIYTPEGSDNPQIKKFVASSNIELLKTNFKSDELSHLITDASSFHFQEVNWKVLKAKSALIFPLKARGQLFGIGILIKENSVFKVQELSFINLVLGLVSLLIYQNFYFAVLKSRLIKQARFLKSIEDVKYSDFFENGPLYVFTLDNRHLILHANRAALQDIQLAGESIIGEDFFKIIPSGNRPLFQNLLSKIQENRLQVFRSPILNQNGQAGIFEFIASSLSLKSQSDLVLVIAGDVSENYYKELIDRRNEILDEIDQFSRILVSQFNNLLTTILPNISLLKDSLSGSNANHHKLDQIEKATQRSANLIQKFLNYDVEAAEEEANTNINKILNAYMTSQRNEFPENIRIKLELDPAIKNTPLYPLKLKHLFDIIVSNSIIALQNRVHPEIQFSTSFIQQRKDGLLAERPFFLKEGKYIEVCIRDNGPGIPERGLTQVLKPFYSTRVKNEGVGLELFIAYNLVKDMKGHIFLDSQVDRFTAVHVFLPFKEEKTVISPTPVIKKSILESQPHKATVLVVDDEYNIRSMMKEIMEMSGLKVFTAGNGQDGVEIYQRNKKEIDLIVMDMVMPVMDGRAAFNEIRKIDPKQKIFIISGYSQREDLQDMLDNGAVGFLRKPFQVKEIVEKINDILSSKN